MMAASDMIPGTVAHEGKCVDAILRFVSSFFAFVVFHFYKMCSRDAPEMGNSVNYCKTTFG